MHMQKVFALNREIQKYKTSLESIRPKTAELMLNRAIMLVHSDDDSKCNFPWRTVGSDDDNDDEEQFRPENCTLNELEITENRLKVEQKESEEERGEEKDENKDEESEREEEERKSSEIEENVEYNVNQTIRSLSPLAIPSQYLIDESYTTNGINVVNLAEKQLIQREPDIISSCSSTQTKLQTKISPKPMSHEVRELHEDFEFIIKPMIMVNIQDTIQSNLSYQFENDDSECQAKSTRFVRESKIAVNQHMSIHIKKLSTGIVDEKSTYYTYMNESTEGNDIIRDVINKESQDEFLILQKYFLRWVHFNTIEKLQRRNPAQTRLQKMEAFLQNITMERKRALNKLRRPGNMLVPSHGDEYKRMTLHNPCAESPRLLIRTYNNK